MKPEVQIADQPRYDPQEIRARVKRMMEKDSLSIKGFSEALRETVKKKN